MSNEHAGHSDRTRNTAANSQSSLPHVLYTIGPYFVKKRPCDLRLTLVLFTLVSFTAAHSKQIKSKTVGPGTTCGQVSERKGL